MMQITLVSLHGDHIEQIEIDLQQKIESIVEFVSERFTIPQNELLIMHEGKPLSLFATFSDCQMQEGDLLMITRSQIDAIPNSAPTLSRPGMQLRDIPANASPEMLLDIFDKNPQLLPELRHGNPELAQAIENRNLSKLRLILMQMHMKEASRRFKEEEEAKALEKNPFDREAQANIEERIRLQNVQKNMEIAIEEMPEAFAKVYMLYISCEVDGVQVKAFVDSGAQATIMSSSCAERCGIMRLVDKRYAGKAVGIGTAKIIGRVHMAPLRIGNYYYNCTFTILDQQDVDLLFGLDMLKRHQCCIDLHQNVLRLHDASGFHEVPFLSEHELPPHANQDGESTGSAANIPSAADASVPNSEREKKIQQLMSLGFDRQRVIEVLESTDGNAETAAGLLFESAGT